MLGAHCFCPHSLQTSPSWILCKVTGLPHWPLPSCGSCWELSLLCPGHRQNQPLVCVTEWCLAAWGTTRAAAEHFARLRTLRWPCRPRGHQVLLSHGGPCTKPPSLSPCPSLQKAAACASGTFFCALWGHFLHLAAVSLCWESAWKHPSAPGGPFYTVWKSLSHTLADP